MSVYLMEHPLEAERLELKTKKKQVLEELKHLSLQPGSHVLELGCGTGAVTRILAGICSEGKVIGVDFSRERLALAEEIARKESIKNVQYIRRDVTDLNLDGEQFDLVYSRCLFQYLPGEEGMDTLARMKGLAKKGGTVSVADIDGNGLYRYPLDKDWEKVLEHFLSEVEKRGFDPYVGRKLYWMFTKIGFEDIRVNILPYYLIAGRADPTTVRVWEMKVQILAETLKEIYGSEERIRELTRRFMKDFEKEEVLLYNLLFMVQGKV